MGTLPSSAEKVLHRHRGTMSPLCAQCRKSMILVICEPDFHNSMVATYRCQECGLLDRAVVLLRASPVNSAESAPRRPSRSFAGGKGGSLAGRLFEGT